MTHSIRNNSILLSVNTSTKLYLLDSIFLKSIACDSTAIHRAIYGVLTVIVNDSGTNSSGMEMTTLEIIQSTSIEFTTTKSLTASRPSCLLYKPFQVSLWTTSNSLLTILSSLWSFILRSSLVRRIFAEFITLDPLSISQELGFRIGVITMLSHFKRLLS